MYVFYHSITHCCLTATLSFTFLITKILSLAGKILSSEDISFSKSTEQYVTSILESWRTENEPLSPQLWLRPQYYCTFTFINMRKALLHCSMSLLILSFPPNSSTLSNLSSVIMNLGPVLYLLAIIPYCSVSVNKYLWVHWHLSFSRRERLERTILSIH